MKKIFFNPRSIPAQSVSSAYKQRISYLKKAWESDTYGLERLLRLFLCLVQFIYPILLVKEIFGRISSRARKLAVEFYILLKLIFPLAVLYFGLYRYHFVIFIIVYLLSETILHILNLIFLADKEEFSLSYHRAILLLLLNYMEVALDFAVIYIGFGLLNEALNPVSAVYFSIVSSTTVGFGDIHAAGSFGQLVVMAQLLICLAFIIVFINYFSQKNTEK
jgi:hypothetical protein